jgi:DNA invertase Pin-like site-specific DNA recombinase
MLDLMTIKARLDTKGIELRILAMNLDTSTPTGKLMMNVLGSVAQFEREMMLERQREGIAKAKAEGKYRGRAPTARAKTDEILDLRGQGFGATAIARELGISVRSVYRALDTSP